MTNPVDRAHRRRLRVMSAMAFRESVRDPMIGLSIVSLFVIYLLVIAGIGAMLTAPGTAAPRANAADADPAVVHFFADHLGAALGLGLMGAGLLGVSVPLVGMRQRGLLRLLGTTPLPRVTVLIASMPFVFVLGAVEVVIAVVAGTAAGVAPTGPRIGELIVTAALVLLVTTSFGLLLGSRGSRVESTQGIAAMLPIVLIVPSEGIFPLTGLPDWLAAGIHALPNAWIIESLGHGITGQETSLPLPVYWALMAGTTAVVLVVAARAFSWDQGEARSRPAATTHRKVLTHA